MWFGTTAFCFLFVLQYVFSVNQPPAANVKIAGIFENIQLHQTAFTYSNRRYNFEKNEKEALVSHIVDSTILRDEPFSALKGTCSFLKQSVVGIFGPQSTLNIDIVTSITEAKDIPHILTRWVNPSQMGVQTINFFPNPEQLAMGFLDIINALNWNSFTVLYTETENLMQIQEFIKASKDADILVYLENVDPYQLGEYRQTLRQISRSGQKNFAIDCPIRSLKNLLTQLQQVGMLTEGYSYFLTNLDAHTEDLSTFQHSDAIITGVHLIEKNDERAIQASKELCLLYNITFKLECGTPELDIETALIIDAVTVFLEVVNSLQVTDGQYLDCNDHEDWSRGLEIINTLNTGTFEGITGPIAFGGKSGFRSSFQLTIYQISRNVFQERGHWNTSDGLSTGIELTFSDDEEDDEDDLSDKNLNILIALTEPYAKMRESSYPLRGNDRFEGFAIDLIEQIALIENFEYTFVVREDHRHGYFDPRSGKWNGMIGDIIEGKADVAIADLTINKERVDPVEFTLPFMSVGIGILFRKPAVVPPSIFHVAEPFAISFWKYLGFSFVTVVVSIFLIARISPGEWQRPDTCKESKKYLLNEMTFLNAFWFVSAGAFRQTTNVKINSISAKILAASWYIFCFVLFAMYISFSLSRNALEEKEELFDDVDGLLKYAEENGIKFGAKKGGSTEAFFKNSKQPSYQEIATHMEENPEDMVESTQEGIKRTLEGDYAFFMESATIDYITRRECSLASYGGLLDSKGFGMALKKGSPLLSHLNKAILKLQSSGELLRLKKKWWEEKYAGDPCEDDETTAMNPKTVEHINGLLWLTYFGTAVAIVLAMFEFIIYVFRLSKRVKLPFGRIFSQEFRKCFGKNHTVQNIEAIALTKPENGNSSNKEEA